MSAKMDSPKGLFAHQNSPGAAPGARSVLRGTVAGITFQNPESRFAVLRLETEGPQEVTVVGEILPISEGEELKVSGFWKMHPRFGLQFQVEQWEKVEPATLEGIERYLGSGLIKGIGPTYAQRLVSAFGLDTLRVLSEEPDRIRKVAGIGKVRAQRIIKAWEGQKGLREAMVFLQGHGISSSLALKIYRTFGLQTVARVQENPYGLAREVYGIGFILADRIAAKIGVSRDSPVRIEAGVLHALEKFSDQGHCFAPLDLLQSRASVLLSVDEEAAHSAVQRLARDGQIILEKPQAENQIKIYPFRLYQAESRVASALRNLLSSPSCLRDKGFKGSKDQGIEAVPPTPNLFNSSTFRLEGEQREAIQRALQSKVLVITGGPGTGKTTLLTHLLTLFRDRDVSFTLAAPTGRAAKRMGELTGEDGKTLHRLLEYNPREGGFQRNEQNRLNIDVVIVDEVSMVDLPLMDHLLAALDPHSHLILIGDVDQLPSVGPGNILRDLIESGSVSVVTLRHIFRQAKESLIVVNAHRILQGESPMFRRDGDQQDFVFIERENPAEIVETVKHLVKVRIPRKLDIEPHRGVQVLTPMHRGTLGTVHLNRELQTLLNPNGEAVEQKEFPLRLGDKVMQLRNNYDKGVFNGDLGWIAQVDRTEGEIQVEFDGRLVSYDLEDLGELSLAYATSIHKSQGSEYPAVVIPLHTSHYMMLHRSILYTAVTRGKKLVVLVGSKKALMMAIKNARVEQRFTGLKERLKGHA